MRVRAVPCSITFQRPDVMRGRHRCVGRAGTARWNEGRIRCVFRALVESGLPGI